MPNPPKESGPLSCPRCGGLEPFHPETPKDAKVCTPITCDAWTFTDRLTKEGPKPIRPDGRADLRDVLERTQ